MTSRTEQQLTSLSEEEWVDLYNRLLLFTHKRYGWLKTRPGWDAHDLVQQAIIDALRGNRRQPRSGFPGGEPDPNGSLFRFLCIVLASNVSHLLEIERRSRIKVTGDSALERVLTDDNLSSPKNSFADIEARILAEGFYPYARGDQELIDMIDAVAIFGCRKREDIADLLGVSPQEVSKRQKRLRSLYHELRDRIHNAEVPDQELTRVVDLLPYTADSTPKEIGRQLGLSMVETYGILKRLRQRLTTMQEEAING